MLSEKVLESPDTESIFCLLKFFFLKKERNMLSEKVLDSHLKKSVETLMKLCRGIDLIG
jgi:hypothetical protein